MRRKWFSVVAAVAAVAAGGLPAGAAESKSESIALFEGRKIDLSKDWGEAEACIVADDGVRCYRSEAELDEAEGLVAPDTERSTAVDLAGGIEPLATCSPQLRLYRMASYSGGTLVITQKAFSFLSHYNFDNATSSYKVGPCAAAFWDNTNATGLYPGNTSANYNAPFMVTGWDNRISLVYIY